MNIISYNLKKFQDDNKLNNKKLALMLGVLPKKIKEMKKENYQHNESEIKAIASMMMITEDELKNEMNERLDLKEKKIYGTDYLFLKYKVNSYKQHKINFISCIIDLVFLVTIAIFLITKKISLSLDFTKTLAVLKVIFLVEVFVFPFMFIVFPLLKCYFNRTYDATLLTKLKEDNQDEACGIIFGCLRRSINKSMLAYFFTLFSEGAIALYCYLYLKYTKTIETCYLIMVIIFVISFVISIMALSNCFGKRAHQVHKCE